MMKKIPGARSWSCFWTRCRPQAPQKVQFEGHFTLLDFQRSASNARRYTPEEDAKTVELRTSGKIFREIDLLLGRPKGPVKSRYRDHILGPSHADALPVKRERTADDATQDQYILEGVEAGKTFSLIGRELGLSYHSIPRRYNLICGTGQRAITTRPIRLFNDADKQSIQRGIAQGLTVIHIALKLERHPNSVRAFVKRNGIRAASTDTSSETVERGHYKPEDLERLWAMKQSGHSWVEIGAALRRLPSSVASRWAYCGANDPTRTQQTTTAQRTWTSAERADLIRLFDQGSSRRELATHFNRRYSTLCSVMRECLKRLGRNVYIRNPWSAEEDAKLTA